MLSYAERLIALRYLRPKRREGFVSVISLFSVMGIMLGVATLILVTSLMNGIREEMMQNFIGFDGHITLYGAGRYIEDSQYLMAEIESKYEDSAPFGSIVERLEGQVLASAGGRAMGAQVLGFHADDIAKKPRLAGVLSGDAKQRFAVDEGVIIGERLMQNLGLAVGQSVMLISPQGRATFAGVIPRMQSYPIIGTLKTGMHMIDSATILMPYDKARIYFALPEREGSVATAIEFTLNSPDDTPAMMQALDRLLEGKFRLYDWQSSNQSVFQALLVQRNVMVIILALIILVAAFNIISSLIMLVQDKGKDIAILRTMGATRRTITAIFCASGTLVGLLGTLLGLGLGLFLAANIEGIKRAIEIVTGQPILIEQIYFLSTLPTKTDPVEVAVIVLFSIGISFAATLYPARRAASLNPAEALRYE